MVRVSAAVQHSAAIFQHYNSHICVLCRMKGKTPVTTQAVLAPAARGSRILKKELAGARGCRATPKLQHLLSLPTCHDGIRALHASHVGIVMSIHLAVETTLNTMSIAPPKCCDSSCCSITERRKSG
jgi:hypothetical protein